MTAWRRRGFVHVPEIPSRLRGTLRTLEGGAWWGREWERRRNLATGDQAVVRGGKALGLVQTRLRKGWSRAYFFLLCPLSLSLMGGEEKVVYTKDLGEGLSIAAVQSVQQRKVVNLTLAERKALDDEFMRAESQFMRAEGLPPEAAVRTGERSYYIGGQQLCSFRLVGKGMAIGGKKLLDVVTDHFAGFDAAAKPETFFDGAGTTVFDPTDYKVYDVCVAESRLFVMMHNLGEMHLQFATVDRSFAVLGGWTEVTLFGSGWERRDDGFLPIERGQVIAAKDRVYAFFVGKSGKCMLWEVQGKQAKMVWVSGGRPTTEQGGQKAEGNGDYREESVGDLIEREEREKGLPRK